jgi:hypothetical protein
MGWTAGVGVDVDVDVVVSMVVEGVIWLGNSDGVEEGTMEDFRCLLGNGAASLSDTGWCASSSASLSLSVRRAYWELVFRLGRCVRTDGFSGGEMTGLVFVMDRFLLSMLLVWWTTSGAEGFSSSSSEDNGDESEDSVPLFVDNRRLWSGLSCSFFVFELVVKEGVSDDFDCMVSVTKE